jgi:hypothetical protein
MASAVSSIAFTNSRRSTLNVATSRPRRRPRSHSEIRVWENCGLQDLSEFAHVKSLTVWIRGERMPGRVVHDVARQCQDLMRLKIERRDNDWDAPNMLLSWTEEEDTLLANGLRNHPNLRNFELTGFTGSTPIAEISRALCTLPQLASVTLKTHPHSNVACSSLPPDVLRTLSALQRTD